MAHAHRPTFIQRLFEAPAIGKMAPGTKLIVYSLLLFWTLVVIFPLYWVVITSLKTAQSVNNGPFFIPWVDFQPSLHAWKDLLVTDSADTFRSYMNSIITALLSTLLCVTVGSMAAYALARISYKPKFGNILMFVIAMIASCYVIWKYGVDWKIVMAIAVAIWYLLTVSIGRYFTKSVGNGDILFWMISQRILPPIVTVVPIYIMFQNLRLLDTHIALILTYAVVNLPIVVWLMYDFMNSIPIELEESAQLDGASRFRTFWEIVLPLSKPGLAATTLLVLILAWNEYILAVFLTTTKATTIPIMVAAMNAGERGILWWSMCVVIIIMIIPVVFMAIMLQKFISKGVLLGAVKG